jgi:cytochrome P450
MLNGQRHDSLRKPFFDASAPAAVQMLRQVIEHNVDLLLQEPARIGHLEIIYEFACPLTTKLIAHWFGIEPDNELEFRRAVHRTCSHFSPNIPGLVTPVFDAAEVLLKHINRLIDVRQKTPSDDVISMMSNHLAKGLSKVEIADNCLLVVFASYETVVHQIGNSVLLLLQNPKLLKLLRTEPSLIKDALDELLRLGGPVQMVTRTVSEGFEYQGKHFQTGDVIKLILSAANRDPIFGSNSYELDFSRPFKKHLSFGLGPHFCIGAHLVRLQLEIVLLTLVTRFPDMRLLEETPRFHPSVGIRGLQELPVILY